MRYLICLVSAISSPAMASCPTGADLATGIRFETADGEWEIYRQVKPDVVEALYHFNATEAMRNVLVKGIYLTEVVDLENGSPVPTTRSVYTYPVLPEDMPMPTPNGKWKTGATVLSTEGMSFEGQTYSFGDFAPHRIGDCTYQMMPIEVSYTVHEEETDSIDYVHWLPELGLAYLAGGKTGDEIDTYVFTDISAVK